MECDNFRPKNDPNKCWCGRDYTHLTTKECNTYNPYISNPQLCRCGRPYTEHPTYMAYLNDKQREKKWEKLLVWAATEIDGNDDQKKW